MFDFGILWINARNLHYIKRFNPAKAIRLADNKSKTKRFLAGRWIPVPETYDIIKDRKQLYDYDFSKLPIDDFIVKPVRWSRGRGIYRVKLSDNSSHEGVSSGVSYRNQFLSPKGLNAQEQKYQILWEFVDDATFRRYLVDILDGKHSLTNKKDTIMIEELLLPGSWFEQYCRRGLADIRIIVFNLIPVACMLRIPTKESDGKANLDRGAVAMGVEIWSWRIYSMYHKWKIYTKHFPEEYATFAYQYLAYRDDILSYSSKIQYFANLGYLALDRVITEDGPKLLEINARAWLKFQNVSVLPLKRRLRRIKDIHITSPDKGVEIAQTLFTKNKWQIVTGSKILYLRQDGILIIKNTDNKYHHELTVEVDPSKKRSYLSSSLYQKIASEGTIEHSLKLGTEGIKFDQVKWKELETWEKNKAILWKDVITDYFIKPIEKATFALDFIHPSHLVKSEVDSLYLLDTKIAKLWRILNISRMLKPTNILEQLDNFITWWGNYNPLFQYRRPADKKLIEVQDEINQLMESAFGSNGLKSDFAHLFKGKLHELQHKLDLIRAYKIQDLDAVLQANQQLFGDFDTELVQQSKERIFDDEVSNEVLWPILSGRELRKRIIEYLKSQGLEQVSVQFDQDSIARMTVSKAWRNMTLKISPKAYFREHELRASLAHEIDVHIKRYINGMETGRQIMKSGTAGYVMDEEGLAVHASQQYLPNGYERKWRWYRYFFLHQGQEKDFASLASLVRGLKWVSLDQAFNDAVRMKKWLTHTSVQHPGALYTKDKIYLDGYTRVGKWIEEWWDPAQLMIGKIKIDDLWFIL